MENKILYGQDYETDLTELAELLKKENIKFRFNEHEAADSEVKKLIGFNPAGDQHIYVGDISIIRGFASFGDYELYGGGFEVDRYETAEEVINAIKEKINK